MHQDKAWMLDEEMKEADFEDAFEKSFNEA